jgi:hypothetical protein
MTFMSTIATAGCMLLVGFVSTSCSDNDVTSPTEMTSPVTVNWSTLLAPGGSASRSLAVTQSGTVSVTLQSAPVPLGLGIGVPQANGSGCRTTLSTTASPGPSPQLTIAVEAGTYCVVVFDVVGLADPVTVALEVLQP